jgi:hypothetical protein
MAAGARFLWMTDVQIPADRVPIVTSRECEAWLLEHTRRSVIGLGNPAGGFVLRFDDDAEAEAFWRRWVHAER